MLELKEGVNVTASPTYTLAGDAINDTVDVGLYVSQEPLTPGSPHTALVLDMVYWLFSSLMVKSPVFAPQSAISPLAFTRVKMILSYLSMSISAYHKSALPKSDLRLQSFRP